MDYGNIITAKVTMIEPTRMQITEEGGEARIGWVSEFELPAMVIAMKKAFLLQSPLGQALHEEKNTKTRNKRPKKENSET